MIDTNRLAEIKRLQDDNTRLRAELEAATSNDCDECRFKPAPPHNYVGEEAVGAPFDEPM